MALGRITLLLNSIVTDVLGLAKKHQTGRVTEKVTNVTFTEGWFRYRKSDAALNHPQTGGERGILEMFFCVYGTIISHSPFTEELLPCAA